METVCYLSQYHYLSDETRHDRSRGDKSQEEKEVEREYIYQHPTKRQGSLGGLGSNVVWVAVVDAEVVVGDVVVVVVVLWGGAADARNTNPKTARRIRTYIVVDSRGFRCKV
jgi:hypothetical protein